MDIKTDFGSGAAGSALEGGFGSFPIFPARDAHALKTAIDRVKP